MFIAVVRVWGTFSNLFKHISLSYNKRDPTPSLIRLNTAHLILNNNQLINQIDTGLYFNGRLSLNQNMK